MLTPAILHQVFPTCKQPEEWCTALLPALARFGIDSPLRTCNFLAQVSHESQQFNTVDENLFYTGAARLLQVFPKYFNNQAEAQPYLRNPQRLGNRVYAQRNGNGDEASGDGFRFHGRGLIQLTGRANYGQAATALQLDLLTQPEQLLSYGPAALSAAWFWSSHGLNTLADQVQGTQEMTVFTEITRRINGGTLGLQERYTAYQALQAALH
ncbi:glycoside hydrolase family 19 protein [Massilia sp. NR 4-1]|uniref:glycoside hydrolase family 19 protein n=1 Tax=Massilia sp. NR 4-1 TaxID=1678028 RepID=UPI00067B4C8F|nr:glycoside hydrolase family 19 protein [Massilia sp. NR 4-1]AKU24793.1 hypothetical protein ACZ75_08855 [Massilia sp. NR 4-1]